MLLGTKKEKGLNIIVEDYYVPPTQHRTVTHCKPYKEDDPQPHEYFPQSILPHIVGSLHSHNSMAAKFSGGDKAPDGICNAFSSSIVIATPSYRDNESWILGFEYEAEVTYTLPCGSLGRSPAQIVPKGIDDWPFRHIMELSSIGSYDYLGDCDEYGESPDSTPYYLRRMGKCGMVETSSLVRGSIFGADGLRILQALPKPYAPPQPQKSKKERKRDREIILVSSGDKDDDYLNPYYGDEYSADRWTSMREYYSEILKEDK